MNLHGDLQIVYRWTIDAYCIYWDSRDTLCTLTELAFIANCSIEDMNNTCNNLNAIIDRSVVYFKLKEHAETILSILLLTGDSK